jgi:hypothetical protein
MSIPSSQAQLKELILNALRADYIARSCKDDIETGNRYQSVRLGDDQTSGFRTDRREFLSQIDFRGKKVLDLGSNLGEISRTAREMGAYLVDGFEYDPYFLEIARMVNTYNEITRVSFYQRDITDPSIYQERYDIVLAFAVFEYIHTVLDRIAASADQIFVLETHRLDDNLESVYLAPILRYFPHYKILGETEWGVPHSEAVRRVVIVFARDERSLTAGLKQIPSTQPPIPLVSIEQSGTASPITHVDSGWLDITRTSWLDCFFSVMDFDSPDDLLSAVAGMDFDLDRMAKSRDLTHGPLGGWLYWVLFIKGFLQQEQSGRASANTVYHEYLSRYFGPQGHDPGLRAILADRELTSERVSRRFEDFTRFRAARHSRSTDVSVDPVTLILRTPPTDDAKPLFLANSQSPVLASVDGYHRLFLARLFGVSQFRCEIVREQMANQREEEDQTAQLTSYPQSDAPMGNQTVEAEYQELVDRIRDVVCSTLPPNAVISVVSKGDDELLRLLGRGARHFPETLEGVYAGYHPADSDEAIVQLEAMRARGTEYLLLPRTSLWWLDHYADFRRYLEQRYQVVVWQEDGCVIFDLREVADSCREG